MTAGTIIVTGSDGAIGSAACRMLRERGYTVIGTSRRVESGNLNHLDQSSPQSIHTFARRLADNGIRIDGLLHNAGTMRRTYATTPEGLELTIATNYYGVYLLTRELLPLLNEGANIVGTVSLTCNIAHIDNNFFNTGAGAFSQLGTYAASKLAVMLLFDELLRRHGDRYRINVTDPGVVDSRMLHMDRWYDPLADALFRPFCKKPEGGATPAVNAVTAETGGRLFRGHRSRPFPKRWLNTGLSQWLWQESEKHFLSQNRDNDIT